MIEPEGMQQAAGNDQSLMAHTSGAVKPPQKGAPLIEYNVSGDANNNDNANNTISNGGGGQSINARQESVATCVGGGDGSGGGSGIIDDSSIGEGLGIKAVDEKSFKSDKERVEQMRSSSIETPPLVPLSSTALAPSSSLLLLLPPPKISERQTGIEEEESGSCELLAGKWGECLSSDLNCHPPIESSTKGLLVSTKVATAPIEQKELEVEWTSASLFKRATRLSGGSRSLCIRTSLVRSIKGKSHPKRDNNTIGKTIKSFVGKFRSSNLSDTNTITNTNNNISAQKTTRRNSDSSEDSPCVEHVDLESETIGQQKSTTITTRIPASVSCQSVLLNYQKVVRQMDDRTDSAELETTTTTTTTATATKDNGTFNKSNKTTIIDISSNITNPSHVVSNMSSGGYLAKNKYIIEDKLRKQQHQQQQTTKYSGTRLEDRRSTYCSSVGAVTTDMNYDSSFSSANNCSESNNTCAMIHECSRDLNDRPDNSNDCKQQRPSKNQCNILMNKKVVPVSEKLKKRENWDKNIEFLLAVIGFAVDLGNVWRFPFVCYKNGGGAFLIPYTIIFILGGLPIFYLEMSLGQYFSSGCLTVWKRVCPMAKGIGYAMCLLNFFTGLYYNTIISWAVFFFVESFTTVLPWTSCNNSWNSDNCRTIEQRQLLNSTIYDPVAQSNTNFSQFNFSRPTKDYFDREVLQVHLSSGIDDLGYIRTPLAIYLAIVYICIYFAIWKGVKSTGKAVWITALLPYFVLIPLLIRGVFLEGAWLGIQYYLYPDWWKILDDEVWVAAAKQIYFSLGPGFGTLMALSSYNKFNHNCRKDALIAASVNYFASFISGLVIFAVLGYMATIENVSISAVATDGPGLVFQVYPEGLATMQFSSMWSVLFFIMVITLGIDSTFGGLESVITGLCDEYPRVLRAHRGIFIGLLIILIYLFSLPTTTYGGNYVINLLESYGTSLSLLFIVLFETIIVCWVYGTDRFCKNLQEMYGEMPGPYWRICWKYISPTILVLIFIAVCKEELGNYHVLKSEGGRYTYPGWAPIVGLLMTGSCVCCIPVYAIYYIKTKTSGPFLERLKIAIRPIEGDQRGEKEIYVEALTDKLRDENDVHSDTVI